MYSFCKSAASIMFLFLGTTHMAVAQGTPKDLYMQMGSVAALAESCYQSVAIPTRLKVVVQQATSKNPSMVPAMKELIVDYNDAYGHSIVDHTIWNGQQQDYNNTPFDCENEDDVALIKKYETMLVQSLR